LPGLAPLFPDAQTVFTNGDDSYMVMGDNTCNSLDSRSWGSFATQNVIGKSFFVYWPLTKRFGWGNQ
jgi:signal peptidase I